MWLYSYNRCQRSALSATSTSKAGVRTEVVASEDRYHHSYGLCIGDHREQIIVYAAQDMSAECYIIATVFTRLMIVNKKYDK